MHYIYRVTNLQNGKIYVGRGTVRTKGIAPEKDSYLGSGVAIRAAIKKYGRDAFVKDILEYCDTIDLAQEREVFWIRELDAVEHGYNLTYDSCGFTPETSRSTSKAFYESLSEEQLRLLAQKRAAAMRLQKDKIAESSKQMWANRSEADYRDVCEKLSKAWTEDMRAAQRERMLGSKRKSVREYMIDKYGLERGEQEYISYRERNRASLNQIDRDARSRKLKRAAQTPKGRALNKYVRQPKATLSRRRNNGTISEQEYKEKFQEIERIRLEITEKENYFEFND